MLVSVPVAVLFSHDTHTVALIGLNDEGIILDVLALAIVERRSAA